MVKNSDLHTHSYYSDGDHSPKELIRLAKRRKIKNLALTDHDSVKGVKEATKEGKKIGVNVIPAVEIRINGGEVLGYFIDINNKILKEKLKENNKKVQSRVKDMCRKLKKADYKISYDELIRKYHKAKGNLNEFHPLYLLYLKGYGDPFKLAKKIWSDEKLRPKKVKTMTVIQGIRLIKKAGGIPVLAHPWIEETKKHFRRMSSYVKAGLKGMEINNGDSLKFMRKLSQIKNIVQKIKKVAKKYNLILVKGTDFHSDKKAKIMPGNHILGKNNCDEKVVNKLKKLTKK